MTIALEEASRPGDPKGVLRRNGRLLVVAVIMPLAVFAVFLLLSHQNPWSLYGIMWNATFGSVAGFAQVVIKTMPFILTGVAAALPARVGLVNVGGEGQLYVGALFSTWAAVAAFGSLSPWIAIPLDLLTGAVGGAAWAAVAALLQRYANISETLVTLLLNYVASFLIGYVVNGPLRDPMNPMWPVSPPLPASVLMPSFITSSFNIGIIISLAIAIVAWFVVEKTRFGFKLRVVGGNLMAARLSGIRVHRVQFWSLVVAGAVAGIAGMLVVTGDDGRLYTSTGVNFGYFGFLASWIAWNRLLWAIPAALLIAAISVAGDALQISSNLPSGTVQILMSLLLFGILSMGGGRHRERLR